MPPLMPMPSIMDIILVGIVITIGAFVLFLIMRGVGYLLEGFSEYYDFKQHMMIVIVVLLYFIYLKV